MSEWIDVGPLENIPPRGARVVTTDQGDIAVFRTGDDQVFALHDTCPHEGGPLSQGMVYGNRVTCPLHNWSIELATGEAVSPDEGCARRYEVRVTDGIVAIRL
ncbi:nitrite reductase small subunit NirD [Thiohalomonas denitrificans]|uniref:Nitrite reductase (NADH) small subunit n=1 Tax=Thiohalomonas denitrificans TaxID=415747 RepID=A0A1G5Q9Z9_9GAMM|nr:nitrite reductase small subunit NirD [Thiohalomonas denitrificans]SCZ58099.1 nitrite reductase (NADH) small subunit [Thiohalomonas denitrificans]